MMRTKQEILDAMKTASQHSKEYVNGQIWNMGDLMSRISDEQVESSAKLEHHTIILVRLTWALVGLTVGLLVFTICLAIRH